MAGLGRKDFEQFEELLAADVNGYLMDQSVMRFASSSARGSAIGTAVSEGMVSYLNDTNTVEVYNGSAWVGLESTLTSGTQGFTALSNGTAGISYQPVSHNYIINGAFDVWQRGDTFTIAGGNANARFTADRFHVIPSGGTATITQEDFTPGELDVAAYGESKHYFKIDCTTGDDNYGMSNRIEDVRTLAGQMATFSFYAKGTNPDSGAFGVGLQQVFTGQTVSYLTTFSVTSSWERYSFTINLGDTTGKTITDANYLNALIFQSGGSTGAWELNTWGWQVEAGSVATPFKRHAPSLQGELAACQRYYYRIGPGLSARRFGTGFPFTTNSSRILIQFPVTMRNAISAIEQSGTASDYSLVDSTGAIVATSVPTYSIGGFDNVEVNIGSTGNLTVDRPCFGRFNSADGFIGVSAEL